MYPGEGSPLCHSTLAKGHHPLQGERYEDWYTPAAQPPVGRRGRAISTTLTPLGGGLGASHACLRHSEKTTVPCHLILTRAAQNVASGQVPIGLRCTSSLLVEPVPQAKQVASARPPCCLDVQRKDVSSTTLSLAPSRKWILVRRVEYGPGQPGL